MTDAEVMSMLEQRAKDHEHSAKTMSTYAAPRPRQVAHHRAEAEKYRRAAHVLRTAEKMAEALEAISGFEHPGEHECRGFDCARCHPGELQGIASRALTAYRSKTP